MLTSLNDAHEGRDVMTADVHNAFTQTELPRIDGKERVIMKLTGELVGILVNINTDLYRGYIVFENGKKILYVEVLRAIYGMLIAALLFYRKFREDMEEHGFQFNPYDSCVANKMIDGKLQTARFHVDNLMSSHVDKKVNGDFLKSLNNKYGEY